jgi:hypothetical protein
LNDIKVLHRNFPIFKEQISPNLNNLTCLYETTKVVKNDENLAKLFFNDDVPEKLKLSNVTEALLGSPLDKREATSIWSSRPLRFDQLVYAAMDSFTVVKLEKFIREKIQGHVNLIAIFNLHFLEIVRTKLMLCSFRYKSSVE